MRCVLTLFCLLLLAEDANVNPLIRGLCSEFWFTPGGWVMELGPVLPPSLDGWMLGGTVDTVRFKNGIQPAMYALITADSLEAPLLIGRTHDVLTLFNDAGHHEAWLFFGETPGAQIASPPIGYSIAWNPAESFYYLDRSPTPGNANDTEGGTGTLRGTVTDTAGLPLEGVALRYHSWIGPQMYTNAAGEFSFTDFAMREYVTFVKAGYEFEARDIQLWPDSTITIAVAMRSIVSVDDADAAGRPGEFALSQNYPNPFNPSTTFEMSLPRHAQLALSIYTTQGDHVATLFRGGLDAGVHRIAWTPDRLAGGVYFCRMQVRGGDAGGASITRKVLLLR